MHYLNTDPSLDKIKEAYPEFRKALNNFKKPPELDPENRILKL